jgi:hypothetical protein
VSKPIKVACLSLLFVGLAGVCAAGDLGGYFMCIGRINWPTESCYGTCWASYDRCMCAVNYKGEGSSSQCSYQSWLCEYDCRYGPPWPY